MVESVHIPIEIGQNQASRTAYWPEEDYTKYIPPILRGDLGPDDLEKRHPPRCMQIEI